jgi:hypothetical protein
MLVASAAAHLTEGNAFEWLLFEDCHLFPLNLEVVELHLPQHKEVLPEFGLIPPKLHEVINRMQWRKNGQACLALQIKLIIQINSYPRDILIALQVPNLIDSLTELFHCWQPILQKPNFSINLMGESYFIRPYSE